MNVMSVIGRLTGDPDLKYSSEDKAYSKFSVAVNRKYDREKSDFFNCVAFGKTAEIISEYFLKGSQIGLVGSMEMEKFTDKSGNNRTSYTLKVETFDFVDKKKSGPNVEGYSDLTPMDDVNELDVPF